MSMFNPSAQWAAETIFRRWPSNPQGAFYMLAYGASPASVDKVIDAKMTHPVTARHLTEERAKNKNQRLIIKTLEVHVQQLEQANADILEANRFEEKNMRRAARVRSDERSSKFRQRLRRVKDMSSRQNDRLRSRIETLEKRLANRFSERSDFESCAGFPVGAVVESLLVAEDLAQSVVKPGTWSAANEIAKRFLKLRTPHPVKRKPANVCYRCPECGEVVNRRVNSPHKAPMFCASSRCDWEGDAS